MKSYQQFFAELKRRKVFRVMAAYGVIGFGVIEVADAIFPRVALPEWTVTLVVWLTLLGFPIAVILAWAFESTPEGVKRTEDATPEEISEIIAQPASRRWMPGLLALAGVALLFGGWWMGQRGATERDLSQVVSGDVRNTRSIAVLPFENMGGEDTLSLAEGLRTEIEAQLVRLADLTVVSVRDFDATTTTIGEIARQYHFDSVLRGQVRHSGDQVRINVFLVDAATRQNLWADDFAPRVTPANLFAVQAEIAENVARKLEADLSPETLERLEAGLSTDNMEALNLYYRSGVRDEELPKRVRYLERAVELDPGFVEAWSRLADLRSEMVRVGEGDDGGALEAVRRTESLAPNSLEALKARGSYDWKVDNDAKSALSSLRAAEKLAPSDAELVGTIGVVQSLMGDLEGGLRTLRRAVSLDPQNVDLLRSLAATLRGMARWEAADQVIERALAVDPTDSGARAWKIDLSLAMHRNPRQTRSLAAELGLDPSRGPEGWALLWLALYERDYEAARNAIERWPPRELGVNQAFRLTLLATIQMNETGSAEPYADSLLTLYESDALAEVLKPFYANALIMAERKQEGMDMLAEAVDERPLTSPGSVGELWLESSIYARYGFPDQALELLDDAIGQPTIGWTFIGHAAWLEFSPNFDSLRDDPRFQALLERQLDYEAEQARLAEAEGPWLP
jgi:TolB-like protein/Tfp pilus assembly protein PilF